MVNGNYKMKQKTQAVEKDKVQFSDLKRLKKFLSQYKTVQFKNSVIVHADCFDVLRTLPESCIDGVVTA